MSQNRASLGLLLSLLLLLGGCYDKLELNELAVADLMAIDLSEDGRLHVTLQLLIPAELSAPGGNTQGAVATAPFYVVDAVGSTLPEAFSLIQAKLSRRLFTSHVQVVILGEEFAKAGIAPVVDTLTRLRELRVTTEVVATRGKAADLLLAATRLTKLPARSLINLLSHGIVPTRTVRDVALAMQLEGMDPFVPTIELASPSNAPSAGGQISNTQEFEVTGVAIFQGDRLVGFAPLAVARGVAWLINRIPEATATIPWTQVQDPQAGRPVKESDLSPLEDELINNAPPGTGPGGVGSGLKNPAQISPFVVRGTTRVTSRIENGELVIKVTARALDDILTNLAGLDFTDPASIPPLEAALARELEERIKAALHLAQKVYQADIFGFGELVHREHPKLWREVKRDWHTLFSTLRVDVQADVKVRRVGLTTNQPGLRQEQLRK